MPEFPLIPFIFILISLAIYIIPSVVAFHRNHPNRWIIFAINMAFGATVIGWIGALVWAFNAAHRSNQANGSHGGESGLNIFVNDEQRVRFVAPTPLPFAVDTGSNDPGTIIAELERLSRLHADHHLNDDEYRQLKAAVLRRL